MKNLHSHISAKEIKYFLFQHKVPTQNYNIEEESTVPNPEKKKAFVKSDEAMKAISNRVKEIREKEAQQKINTEENPEKILEDSFDSTTSLLDGSDDKDLDKKILGGLAAKNASYEKQNEKIYKENIIQGLESSGINITGQMLSKEEKREMHEDIADILLEVCEEAGIVPPQTENEVRIFAETIIEGAYSPQLDFSSPKDKNQNKEAVKQVLLHYSVLRMD